MTFFLFVPVLTAIQNLEKLILPLAGLGFCDFTNAAFLSVSLALNRELVTCYPDRGLFWRIPLIGLLLGGIKAVINEKPVQLNSNEGFLKLF